MAELKKLKLTRASCKGTVTRIEMFVNDSANMSSTTIDALEARREKLLSTFKLYENVQLGILTQDEKDPEDVGLLEEKYFAVLAKLNEAIKILSQSESSQTGCMSSSKLPNVEIPTFDGKDFTKFKPFFELFIAVIDSNRTLSDVQKLFYLRKYLLDEALSVIVNLPLVNKSYKEALDLLKKRFDNKTRLICNHINIILDIPPLQKGTAASIRTFISQLQQQLHALKNLNEPVDNWDRLLLCILNKKLDLYTNRAFQLERDPENLPTMAEFIAFLERRAMALEDSIPTKGNSFDYKSKPVVRVANFSQHNICKYCDSKDHAIFTCPKFKTVPIETRLSFVKDQKLCSICIRDHPDNVCQYKFKCKICKKPHNTLLHNEEPVSLFSNDNITNCNILLPTIKVKVIDKYGRDIVVRALLDSGSQASFITNALVKRLRLDTKSQSTNIIGIGNKTTRINETVNLSIYSCCFQNVKFNIDCNVVDSITTPLPQQFVDISKINIPKDIQLSDSQFNVPSEISILLGAETYFNSLLNGSLKILNGPVLQNTVFGYVVAGKVAVNNPNIVSNLVSNFVICNESKLENVIEKFWLTEKLPEPVTKVTDEFQKAEKVFQQSAKLEGNRFSVDIPLVCPKNELQLGDSFSVALQRFLSLEKRFKSNPVLLEQYKMFIEQYVAMGHAREVDIGSYDINDGSVYFLAHHPVYNEASKTTKLRVVFDGSMKSKSKKSLNDVMLNGPVVQGELFDILLLFRTYVFTLICDIEKMFRCIFINSHHTSLQNILWRDNPSKPISCLQLQTVTYGLKASTFLATRCLLEIAYRYKEQYPLAAQALLSNTYVDDVLAGCDDIEQLHLLKNQLVELLKLGNFKLHKWCSNKPSVLDDIPETDKYFEEIDLNKDNVIKALGLKYNIILDHLYFQTPQCDELCLKTKRKILSYIGKIFDPLGIIGPIIVVAKLIMQELWSIKIGWDQELPCKQLQQWMKFITNLKLMDKISVPRSIISQNFQSADLVGYADASLKSFGCCLYLRILKNDGSIETNLVVSKSRVAPLAKVLTIPQLELNAALLLAQLATRVSKVLSSRFPHLVFLYSDSQIVLAWIASGKVKSNTYVNNRVQQIVELTGKDVWFYVKSLDNPADLLSRGVEPCKLKDSALWWHGPDYLSSLDFNHERNNLNSYLSLYVPDAPKDEEIPCLFQKLDQPIILNLLEKYSSINKLQNVIAYIYRFYNNALIQKENYKDLILTPIELQESLLMIIRSVQNQHFSEEINLIKNKKNIKSGIANLHPFIDARGVLRVGGRLQNAGIPHDKMHPVILPKNCKVTYLLIEREHLRLLHAGPRLVLSSLSQKYWIVSGIREVKKVLHKCVKCIRMKAQTAQQLMGSLPAERITATRPFQHVGIDFCGPFNIKVARIRKPLVTKGYIALFVCFATKAIHVETVSDLTTDTFLACFNRFISRRGMPTKVFCDNAKTFKGAENQLKELYNLQSSGPHRESVYSFCKAKYIKFMFIPSYSPEFGGLWEAGVKSVKYHIKRVVGNLCLTYEEFNTVIVQIEGILNSRPLLALNPNEGKYLTPGHFLIGTALCSYPEVDLSLISINRLKFWKVVSKLKQDFWKTWSSDYLTQLQSRPKWKHESPNIKEGDLVLVKNINTAPLQWPLARIVKVIPGRDNNVRVAEVQFNNKTYLRSIAKLCPLPIS